MKRMFRKLTAIIMAVVLLVSGGCFEPGKGMETVRAEEVNGELLEVDYRTAHASLQAAAEEAMADTAPENYSGIAVSGENVLDGEDFAYLNTVWSHASVMDLGHIRVKDNAMGMNYTGEGEGTEQIIGTLYSEYDAVQVETLILPADLSTLDQGALAALDNLKELEIPASVTEIGWAALFDLHALEKVSYHGTGLISLDGSIFYKSYGVKRAVALDFSNAAGLETIDMSRNSAFYIADFDFTGCASLNSVDLSGQLLDFSGGKAKEWLDSFEGTAEFNGQRPMLAIGAEPMEPLEPDAEFTGPPALQGRLLDGTDVLAADAVLPDWIDMEYIGYFKDASRVTVQYINPFGVENKEDKKDTLDTSVGGTHTIRWKFSVKNPLMDNTAFELPVEVMIPDDRKMEEVYVDSDKITAGDGTEGNPLSALSVAFSYLKEGGKLHLKGDAQLPEGIKLPADLTIQGDQTEGASKPVLTLLGNLSLSSDLTIDGVRLAADKDVSLYANGHTLTFGENMAGADDPVNIASRDAGGGRVSIYGGGPEAVAEDTNLVLMGGDFANVFGGGYVGGGHGDNVGTDGSVTGSTKIQIGGAVTIEKLYGGGNLAGAPGLPPASVNVGNTSIEMSSGKVDELYGGGFSQADGTANAGETHLTITGGEVGTLYGGGCVESYSAASSAAAANTEILIHGDAVIGTVYGGGYAGLGDHADVAGNVKLVMSGNASVQTVYGGGYVFDSQAASAKVCGNVDIFYQGGSGNRIYGAGKYAEYNNHTPMENAGVEGNVTIHAEGGNLQEMSLGGKGPDGGDVKGTADIIIQDYGADTPQKVSTLYHFDNLILDNSQIIFPMNTTPNLSCDDADDCSIEMKNGSSMTFQHALPENFAINNLTAEGEAGITLFVHDTDGAVPLAVNGKISVSQPITLKLEPSDGREPQEPDQVFITTNKGGNDSLLSKKFSLQNEGFRLMKKEGALILASLSGGMADDPEDQDPPRGLEGVAPNGYYKADGEISGIKEEMEYALNPDGPFMRWETGKRFAAGTYYVRYAANTGEKLSASDAVPVVVPEGQHTITYHVENAELSEDAPRKVANGGSFIFQCSENAGYQLDWQQCSVTSGTLTQEGKSFKVENVTEDVTVNIIATEIPGMVKITKQPHDVTVRAGHSAVFEIAAEGDPEISYQWQADKGRGFSDITGETDPTLTIKATEESADQNKYCCVVTNRYGKVTSKTVTLQVLAAGETIAALEQDNAIEGITAQTQAAVGDLLPFWACGAGMENTQPAQGDIRFVPQSWTTAMDHGEWTDAPYTAAIRTNRFLQGRQTLFVTFLQQRFNGAEWEITGVKAVKTVTFLLEEKEGSATQSSDDGDSENPGSDDGGSGVQGSGNQGSGTLGSDDGGSGNQVSDKQASDGQKLSDENLPDKRPDTGDKTPVELYATMTMIFGFTYFAYWMEGKDKITEQKKKKPVDCLIAWARKGGRLRRVTAIIAISVVLLYSHTIGKYTSAKRNAKTMA